MPVEPSTPIELVEKVYERLPASVDQARSVLGRPLTYTEKVLFNHLRNPGSQAVERGVTYKDRKSVV